MPTCDATFRFSGLDSSLLQDGWFVTALSAKIRSALESEGAQYVDVQLSPGSIVATTRSYFSSTSGAQALAQTLSSGGSSAVFTTSNGWTG